MSVGLHAADNGECLKALKQRTNIITVMLRELNLGLLKNQRGRENQTGSQRLSLDAHWHPWPEVCLCEANRRGILTVEPHDTATGGSGWPRNGRSWCCPHVGSLDSQENGWSVKSKRKQQGEEVCGDRGRITIWTS